MRFAADRPLGVAPATVLDYRELARRRLPRQLFDYVDGGAYEEGTMRANVADLESVLLRQVVMRDVSERDPSVEVLGQRLALPLVLAPVGLGGMLAPRAEVQAARAAEAAGVPFVESTVSICPIEEVAEATSAPPWFQLYVMRDRAYAEDLMARAEAVGSPVLVLTIDLAVVTPSTLLLTIMLMFIGGASASTAGGIKVGTAAVAGASVTCRSTSSASADSSIACGCGCSCGASAGRLCWRRW